MPLFVPFDLRKVFVVRVGRPWNLWSLSSLLLDLAVLQFTVRHNLTAAIWQATSRWKRENQSPTFWFEFFCCQSVLKIVYTFYQYDRSPISMHRKALADRYDLKAVDQMGIRIHRPNGGHISFFLATCFLVILSLVSMSSAALNSGEKAALEEILLRYPDLMNVPAWASTTTDGKYLGKSWEFGFDAVCASPGYDLYGVHCSEQGHIDGLFMYVF